MDKRQAYVLLSAIEHCGGGSGFLAYDDNTCPASRTSCSRISPVSQAYCSFN